MQVNSEENDRHKEAVYEILNRNLMRSVDRVICGDIYLS